MFPNCADSDAKVCRILLVEIIVYWLEEEEAGVW